MSQEIERKFLVKGSYKELATGCYTIKQGYLSSIPERTVRIRITDDSGFITIKGKSDESGTTRFEWENEIPHKEAIALFELCEPGRIEKTRYIVEHDEFLIEVDEFYGENEGLVVAEIELVDKDTPIDLPAWIGEEVTKQKAYYNSQLTKNPYSSWKDALK